MTRSKRIKITQLCLLLLGLLLIILTYFQGDNDSSKKEILSKNLEERITKELEDKMSENMEHIIDWFGGDGYSESTREMKVRRMAKGGDISDKQYLDSLAEERFKLGRVVEDSIENIEAPEAQQGPQGIPEEQVQQQMQQVQQQAEQQIKQVTQQSMQQAKEAEQKAMGMAKEAEQRAMQKAQEAERNAKFYEMQRKSEMDAVIKTAQQELATERARNKIAELSMTLKYDQKIFDLEKNLEAHRKQVDDKITTAIEEEKNAEQVTVVVEEI